MRNSPAPASDAANIPADSVVQAVLLTPPGRGAIATILVQGAGAARVVGELFQPVNRRAMEAQPCGRIVYGRWQSASGEELIVCRRDPEHLEIHCHGGDAAPAAILESLVAAGCSIVDWRQWAVENESDPFVAAARVALASARTERTAAVLLDQYQGALRRAWNEIVDDLQNGRAADARDRLQRLLARGQVGRHLIEPWKIVLAGRPNVGKSSLINALIGYRRAIVDDAPGTTRDVVTAAAAFDGWPVELADTAGLRPSDDPLEAAGVELAQEQLARADVIVLVFDITSPWTSEERGLIDAWPDALVVHNKCDLTAARDDERTPGLATSAVTRQGLADLEYALVQRLVPQAPALREAVPFTERQVQALALALQAVERGDQAAAQKHLQTTG